MGLLQITALLLLAICTGSNVSGDYVVLAPKVIRPGLVTKLQYNARYAKAVTDVVTEIYQQNVKKYSSMRSINPGQVLSSSLDIPSNLAPGNAKIRVTFNNGNVPIDTQEASVKVASKSLSIFIQTDKAMYKPSQTVNFRVVVVDSNMIPYRGSCDVEMKDAEGNKIKQWKSVDLVTGTLTLKLELSDQPVLGDWTIKAITDKGETQEKKFTVDKYVLPKFEVTVDAPTFMLVTDSQVKATVDAKYTYGKGLDGTATVTVSNPGQSYWGYDPVTRKRLEPRTLELKGLTLVDGKVDVLLTEKQLKAVSYQSKGLQNGNRIAITANVTEKLTGITRSGTTELKVYTSAEKLEFLSSSPSTYKPGLTYTGFLKLSQVDGSVVLKPKTVNLNIAFRKPDKTQSSSLVRWGFPRYVTESKDITISFSQEGLAKFTVDVPADANSVTLVAKYDNSSSVQTSKTLSEVDSSSKNFIQLGLQSSQLQAGNQANFVVSSTKPGQMVDFQIWARGSMVTSGSVKVDTKSSFSIQMEASMAPSARIIAYAVEGKELLVDSLNFNVEGAFDRNQVSVSYSKNKAQPGETVDVRVNAVSGSLVGLLAVDQSVLLLAGGNDITQSDVVSELQSYDTVEKSPSNRLFFWYPYSISGKDTKTILSNSGVVALTSFTVYEQPPPTFAPDRLWDFMLPPGMNAVAAGGFGGGAFLTGGIAKSASVINAPVAPKPPPTGKTAAEVVVRKVFPESWLWSNITSVNGKVIVTTTVPDTITSWVASAFAVSPIAGLGVSAEAAKMQVFKPFFVSLNLPYSVVRGEELVLQAIVFNYMNRDTNVTVTLPASDEYKSIVVDASGSTRNVKQQETVTVLAKANKGTTVSFPLVPLTIGKMTVKVTAVTSGAADAVQRDLLVEAEGVEKEYNQAVLISLKNSTSFTETVAIDFPPNVVSDSARVEFSVIGDVMGPSINGLEKLIKMPYGCGEQNMLNFAPTIFVTEYLTQTNQLTGEVKDKSVGFMEKGYQRELTYQRKDGSFSAFGQRDPSGSMWLTAFVAKSFQKARDFIFVDEETILRAVRWIIARQKDDGSFPEPGRIIHKEMLGGGASSTVTLTAFVLTAISEVKLRSTEIAPKLLAAQSKAQKYLESQASSLSDPYSLALTSYALFKSGSNNVDITFDPLQKLSKREGGFQYWVQPQPEPASNKKTWRAPHQQGKAVNIELAAYVLQLVTERSGIADGTAILKWISAQRNSNGGFSSTQDTVVALQALAKYAKYAYGNSNMTVDITASGSSHSYSISSSNALVLQSRVLDPDTKSVTISASGSGMALAQVSATYNVEDYEQEPAFDTVATIISESNDKIVVKVCTRWLLTGTTGMAVKEIGIPSGFSADVEALENMKYSGVKRIEEGDRKIILYFEELGSDERCVEVAADRTGLVAKARPVAIKVYDYYEPENQQTIFYSSTRLNNINICDVCGATCEGCTAYFKRK